jgi:NAD+ synthase (glutamine-hydrolysing)
MKLIKIAAAVLNQTPLDWNGNRERILATLDDAREKRASIVCLPELCITGYGCEDAFLAAGVVRTAWELLNELLPATKGLVASLGLPLLHYNALFNTACLAVDGRIAGFVAKRYLAGEGLHYEPRWFKPWPAGQRAMIHVDGAAYPLGDVHFDVGGIKIGFEICEDAWVAKRPGGDLSLAGVDIILNPSASHFAFGKKEVRRRFVMEGSRAFGVSYVYSNLVGNEAGRAIYDGGALVASCGRLEAAGPRFTFRTHDLTTAVIDADLTRINQARTASYKPNLESDPAACVACPFEFPQLEPEANRLETPGWEDSPYLKEEEFTRAMTLGLFDYLRKSRSRGFVVSLSGGADSTAVSCLVAMTVHRAMNELGREEFLARLAHVPGLANESAAGVVRSLLTCVYQATRNSGPVTRSAAVQVAEAVGAEYMEFDVDSLVQDYIRTVAGGLGRDLSWESDDLALQNIQARVRAPGVWMLANVKGSLLLATSNRSEAAVGYATMDGDTCGGLSPIAGIDKAFLLRWLSWLECEGPEGLGSIPAVRAVTVQTPTAELRPPAAGQTDEADLMPYPVLDWIERAAIRDKRTPLESFKLGRLEFPEVSIRQLEEWVCRFFRLWCRNQWKRERYAPSFHLDDENLDPKTWCRFPILSGGYERELAELRDHVRNLP